MNAEQIQAINAIFEAPEYAKAEGAPYYELNEDTIVIHDPVWGRCEIGHESGDEIFHHLLDTSLVRRAMAIEQLTLSENVATIPGTANFSRWEHIWGSVVFVRKMTEGMDMEPRERLILQLRTFVSDLAHTAYSHLGDFMFQGHGGPEDEHDNDLMMMLEATGVNDILRLHDIDPQEVVFPAGEDWVECPSPDPCVDRIDYGAREIQRWLCHTPEVREALQPESFQVLGGRLVMKDHKTAKAFAKAFLILSTEHHSEPAHRLQLQLQEALVKSVITAKWSNLLATGATPLYNCHPRDLMYTVDKDITRRSSFPNQFANTVQAIMENIAQEKRSFFVTYRRRQLALFLAHSNGRFPDPTKYYTLAGDNSAEHLIEQPGLTITPVTEPGEIDDFGNNTETIDFFLPALKPRRIDPLFMNEHGEVERLSQADAEFASLVTQQASVLKQAYVARLHVDAFTKQTIEAGLRENEVLWQEAIKRPRMSPAALGEYVRNTIAVAAAYRLIDLAWNR